MKTSLTNVKLSSSKLVQGAHLIVLDENASGNAGGQASMGYSQPTGGGGGEVERPRRKPGKKVQFQVVSEGGRFVIKDIRVSDR
jgi:hypothetical protein